MLGDKLYLSGQTTSALLNTAAISNSSKKRKKEQQGGPEKVAPLSSAPPFPASHYTLTLAQMEAIGYPVPVIDESSGLMKAPEGYVASPSGMFCM